MKTIEIEVTQADWDIITRFDVFNYRDSDVKPLFGKVILTRQ